MILHKCLVEELPCGIEESIHYFCRLISKQIVLVMDPPDNLNYSPKVPHELFTSFNVLDPELAALLCSLGTGYPFSGEGSISDPKLFTSAPLGKELGPPESIKGGSTATDSVPDPDLSRDPPWTSSSILDDRTFGAMIVYQN